jgi:hypothetical protein
VNADDTEDSLSPEDLPTENLDDDPADCIEDTLPDADSLSDIPDDDQLMSAKQDIDDDYSTQNSAQGPTTPEQERQPPPKTKYSLRTKTTPPSRLMFASSRTSCPRGGRYVKPLKN